MRKKKQSADIEIPNPLRVDEAEFTEVIRKMVNTSPVTREEVEQRGLRRKRNPGTHAPSLPVFPEFASGKKKR